MADYDITYTFDTQVSSTGWIYDGPDYVGIQNKDTDGAWCWTSTGTQSTITGPASSIACVYTETSSPVIVGDEFIMTLENQISAIDYALYTTFDISLYGDAAGLIYFEAYDGNIWNVIDSWNLGGTQSFQSKGSYDFTSYNNADFKIRFRTVVDGTAYNNDFAVDNIRIYGNVKSSKPTIQGINNITGVQSITI